MSADALAGLIAELPEGVVVTDPDILASYRQDRAADPSAGTPLAVVRPRRTEEVQTVMRWATANQIAVVPRGMGTGLSGGATALNGGIVLSTEKMRDITVDPVTRTAVAQPGLLNAEVKKTVAEYGLWYPPDPCSWPHAGSRSQRWRPRAHCCSRTSASRCRRWPIWSAGSQRSPRTTT